MSAGRAAVLAGEVKNHGSVEAKLDKLAEAIVLLARALDDVDRQVDRIKSETSTIYSRVNSIR